MSSNTATPSDRAMDNRLSALEMKLGLWGGRGSSSSRSVGVILDAEASKDIEARLSAVQRSMEEHTTPEFRSVWKESMHLLQELDPGAGLTHQQQPLLYKRQEVLASAETLQRDFDELAQIRHLLTSSSTSSSTAASSTMTLDAVTQAPILTQIRISADDQRRLDALRVNLEDLNARTRSMTLRLSQLLEIYHTVLSAASEKCILADEVLASRELISD